MVDTGEELDISKEIKKLLLSHGLAPVKIQAWFDEPLIMWGYRTPRELINDGRGQELLDIFRSLYIPEGTSVKDIKRDVVDSSEP